MGEALIVRRSGGGNHKVCLYGELTGSVDEANYKFTISGVGLPSMPSLFSIMVNCSYKKVNSTGGTSGVTNGRVNVLYSESEGLFLQITDDSPNYSFDASSVELIGDDLVITTSDQMFFRGTNMTVPCGIFNY